MPDAFFSRPISHTHARALVQQPHQHFVDPVDVASEFVERDVGMSCGLAARDPQASFSDRT